MTSRQHTVVAGLGWLLLIATSLWLLGVSWDGLIEFRSQLDAPLKPGAPGTPITNRLLIVLLDGLRTDTAKTMPKLQQIAAKGTQGEAIADVPSYSRPTMAAIVTGACHDVHGIATNDQRGPLRVDNIFGLAREKGITTAMVQEGGGVKLYNPYLDITAYTRSSEEDETVDDDVVAEAKRIIVATKDKPLLMWVHLCAVDHAGHLSGGNSPEYLRVAANTDKRMAQVVNAWFDASLDSAVILTADHGHRNEGGHGGEEDEVIRVPLVLAGKGILPGTFSPVSQRAIATTACFMLGLRFPSHAEEMFAGNVFAVSPELLLTRSLDFLQQQLVWNEAFAQRLGVTLPPYAPQSLGAYDLARMQFARLAGWRSQARDFYWRQGSAKRLGFCIAIACLWLLLLLAPLVRKGRGVAISFVALLLFQAGIRLAWYWQYQPISLSLIITESPWSEFFRKRAGEALLIAFFVMLLLLASFARRYGSNLVVRRALTGMAAGAFAVVLLFYWQYGIGMSDMLLPPISGAFHVYMAMLHCVVLGVCGLGVTIIRGLLDGTKIRT
jgi:hypothetical protein